MLISKGYSLKISSFILFTLLVFNIVSANTGIWISSSEIAVLPTSGTAYNNVLNQANQAACIPNLANQDDTCNVKVLAQALIFAKTRQESYRTKVISALTSIVNSGTYNGRALALGRELGAYIIAADLIDLNTFNPSLDSQFRNKIIELRTTPTIEGPNNLIDCHEVRPNNWGTHCGATRAAIASYLNDQQELQRINQVFKGWLGDRSSYSGFSYGDVTWQCNQNSPVGINAQGCTIQTHNVDGVLPDDQRRGGSFTWPPPKENYVWEALQGATVQAELLYRSGYDIWSYQNQALKRSLVWLHTPHFSGNTPYPAEGDDTWIPHLVNFAYGTNFQESTSQPGKNMGWTDWTHSGARTQQQYCSDGTPYGQCSTNQPLYCNNGQLINNCQQCGCPQGLLCNQDGTCTTQVPNQPPIATITQPTQTSFTVNTTINYAGTGNDPEEGNLPCTSLSWSYDITGDAIGYINLGTGCSGTFTPIVIINAQPTIYTIKLVVADSQGLSGFTTKVITINPIVQQTCTDSDGGLIYDIRGTTTNGITTRTDDCKNRNSLREYHCVGDSVSREVIDCRSVGYNRCSSGTCIRNTGFTSQNNLFDFFSGLKRSPDSPLTTQTSKDNLLVWFIVALILICGLIYLNKSKKNVKRNTRGR